MYTWYKQDIHKLSTNYFIPELNIFYTQFKHNLFLTDFINTLHTTTTHFKNILYSFYTQPVYKINTTWRYGAIPLPYRQKAIAYKGESLPYRAKNHSI